MDRKYRMTRIAAGDYLLPGNDGKTLWRIRRYVDGPSSGLEDMDRDRSFWMVERWVGPLRQPVNVDEPAHWECMDSLLARRSDAVDAALKMGAQ